MTQEKIVLINGDCYNVIESMVDEGKTVDMVCTDPPYEISLGGGGGMMGKNGRYYMENMDEGLKTGFDVGRFLSLLLPLFKTKQHFCGVFFCSNKQLHSYLSWAIDNGLQYGVGVWNKTNPPPLCHRKYLNDVEYWIWIKGNKSPIHGSYATKSMVYTSQTNVKESKEYGHPTVKPLPLLERFITNHTQEGATVLDPFMGTGSTGVACKQLNRNFIGIELKDTYSSVAENRILVYSGDLLDQCKE